MTLLEEAVLDWLQKQAVLTQTLVHFGPRASVTEHEQAVQKAFQRVLILADQLNNSLIDGGLQDANKL